MNIMLYKNISDNNVLNKNITLLSNKNVKLKNDTNIINPSILINGDISNNVNYVYIPKWNRYYYVVNKTSLNNNIYQLDLKVDVLMSHKTNILNSDALVDNSENMKNNYISSDVYTNDIREKTKVINFSNGFNNEPQFVLITAGSSII